MLKTSIFQKIFLSLLGSLILLFLGLAILAISLFTTNRKQAAGINQFSTTEIIKLNPPAPSPYSP